MLHVAPSSDPVAAYESLPGASRAVARLVEEGFDETRVGIVPRGWHVEPSHAVRRRLVRGGAAGAAAAVVGVAVAEFIVLGGIELLVTSIVLRLVVAAGAGAVLAALGIVVHAWWRASRTLAPTDDQLEAERFEVVVDDGSGRARHALASWYDPDVKAVRRA